jgi:hypothetical protein
MKFLTTLFLTLLCVSVFTTVNAQIFNKPRYLRFPTPACPVDISKQLDSAGLLKANTNTISVFETIRIEKSKSDLQNKDGVTIVSKDDVIKTSVRDTAILHTLLFDSGLAFDVVQQIGRFSLIKFWGNKRKTNYKKQLFDKLENILSKNAIFEGFVTVDNEEIDLFKSYYIIPTDIMLNNSVEFESKYHQWNVGILVLPVKLRPFATESGYFDFLDGFSLGTSFSINLDHNWVRGRSQSIVFYAGLSSFNADSAKIKEYRQDYKITAFSPAVGYMIEKSGIQLCGMIGFDFPVGAIQKKWVYRNMPWISIGLGFSIFKIANNDANKTGKN